MDESATGQFKLRPHHCGISVPNLEASIAWYRDVLGFSLDTRGHIEKAKADVAFMKQGNFCIELFEVKGAEPLPDSRRHPDSDVAVHGTKHIAFEVQDLAKLMAHLKQHGVEIVTEHPYNGYIRDNSGILVEFMQAGWALSKAEK